MTEFKITWPDGTEQTVQSPHDREGLMNEMWGSAFAAFEERGGLLEELGGAGSTGDDDLEDEIIE